MRKLIILIILISIPLFVLAANNFFGIHPFNPGHHPQMQNERSYRLLHRTTANWNTSNSSWENESDYVYHYIPNNPTHPDSITVDFWDSDANAFTRIGVYLISYNNSGDLVTNITMNMNMGLSPITFQRMHFIYSPQGYLIEYDISMYNQLTGTLDPFVWMKIDYVDVTNYQSFSWTAHNSSSVPEWTNTTFQWDGQGRVVSETSQTSPDSVSWTNDAQTIHEYLPGDTTTGAIFLYNFSHQLPLLMTGNYNGPDFGLQSQSVDYSWNGNWVNETKQVWTYGAANVMNQEMDYRWMSSYWSEDSKIDYTYDSHNNVIEMVSSTMGASWINDVRTDFDWANVTANSDETTTPQIQSLNAYPNPVRQTGTVTFDAKLSANEMGSLTIYNLKGQKVTSFAVNSKNSKLIWNSRDNNNQLCAAGIYFYCLSTNKQTETKKLVILK